MWDLRATPGSIVWLDVLAIPQNKTLGHGSFRQETSSFQTMRRVIEKIGHTRVIAPGGGSRFGVDLDTNGMATMLPFRRSWCIFEMIFTPKDKIELRIGWSDWDYEEHRKNVEQIAELDIKKASTSLASDHAAILKCAVGTNNHGFRSIAEVNTALRSIVRRALYNCAKCALEAEDGDELFVSTGLLKLDDERVPALYSDNPG